LSRSFRYTFILAVVAVGTALAAVGGWRYARASAPVPGPIVLVSIDTLRADHLPAYGYTKGHTPAIDTLARDGVLFERAYAHAVQTLPSHVALLSGRLPFETGVRDDGDVVKPGERLLGQLLRDRGYRTGAAVSGGALRTETGIAQGFDFFDSDMPGQSSAEEPSATPIASGLFDDLTFASFAIRDGAKTEAIAERWLGSAGSNRLFLFVHLNEPHAPDAPTDRTPDLERYDAAIARADEVVGQLVRYLKRHQLYDQSTIVLTSDHGEGLGDHGEQAHGLFLYDEIVHVPLIVKQAESVGAGRRVRDVVQHIDIAPTILDLAKAPGAGGLRGRSLKPLLEGAGGLPALPVYAEAPYGHRRFGWSEIFSLTDESRRLIRSPQEEFYDLQRDPREHANLLGDGGPAAVDPAVERMRAALDRLTGAQSQEDATVESGNKVSTVERYRSAQALAGAHKWPAAIALLQDVLRDEPSAAPVWNLLSDLAMRAERYDLAADAADRAIELEAANPRPYLRKAAALLKMRRLDDAREFAEQARALAESEPRLRTIARVMVVFADARALQAQGHDEDSLALLEQAIADLQKVKGAAVAELHLAAAETLDRLDREEEAEAEFLQELRLNPQHVRARAALAAFYQRHGRTDEAAAATAAITRLSPTPDAYAVAARLWASLGDRKQAEATRAEARELFGPPRRAH